MDTNFSSNLKVIRDSCQYKLDYQRQNLQMFLPDVG